VLEPGVSHMNYPGLDLFNLQVDDVLTPKGHAATVSAICLFRKPACGPTVLRWQSLRKMPSQPRA